MSNRRHSISAFGLFVAAAALVIAAMSQNACSERPPVLQLAERPIDWLGRHETYAVKTVTALSVPGSVPLGLIARAVRGQNGDWFVGDQSETNSVYRFGSSGQYIATIPLPAVGDKFRGLRDFAVSGDSLYMLGDWEVVRIDLGNPGVVDRRPLLGPARRLAADAGRTCVMSAVPDASVFCTATTLAEAASTALRHDARFLQYGYGQPYPLAVLPGGSVVQLASYAPEIQYLEGLEDEPQTIKLESSRWNEAEFAELWRQPMSDSTRTQIRSAVRRFDRVWAVGPASWVVREVQRTPRLASWILMDAGRREALRDVASIEPFTVGRSSFSLLDIVVGSSDGVLVGRLPDRPSSEAVGKVLGNNTLLTACKEQVQCLVEFTLRADLLPAK